MAAESGRRYAVPAVERAFEILRLAGESPGGLRVTDASQRLGLAKSSAYVLLNTLEQLGYLERRGRDGYRLTLRLYDLGRRALGRFGDIRGVALPHLVALRHETGLTVHLAVLDGTDIVYLEKVEGPGFVKFDTYPGKRAPLHLTAVGKALAAFLPEEQLDRILVVTGVGGGTDRAAATPEEFKAGLGQVRQLGFAVDDEEQVAGIRCIGAPIRDHAAEVVASISIVGLTRELPAGRFAEAGRSVAATAGRISADLGHRPDSDHGRASLVGTGAAP